MNKDLDRAIKDADKKLVKVESKPVITDKQSDDIDRKIHQIGKATLDYGQNLRILIGGISNPTDQERQTAIDGIKWYENYIAVAKANAAKAGVSAEELDEYSQKCKTYYEEWLTQELRNVKIVMHNNGTMTSTNERTSESARFDNEGNLITE